MLKFRLKGIAEGLAGVSYVEALSAEGVFKQYPLLSIAKDKISVRGKCLVGIVSCDG